MVYTQYIGIIGMVVAYAILLASIAASVHGAVVYARSRGKKTKTDIVRSDIAIMTSSLAGFVAYVLAVAAFCFSRWIYGWSQFPGTPVVAAMVLFAVPPIIYVYGVIRHRRVA